MSETLFPCLQATPPRPGDLAAAVLSIVADPETYARLSSEVYAVAEERYRFGRYRRDWQDVIGRLRSPDDAIPAGGDGLLRARSSTVPARARVVDRVRPRGYAGRLMTMFALAPREGLDRVRHKLDVLRERSAGTTGRYATTLGWEEVLHRWTTPGRPCEVAAEFDALYPKLLSGLPKAEDLPGHAHDADVAMARAVFCAVRHLRPQRVVETGVARGITTRVILEALERNGCGHLWSIDLPPMQDPWHRQVGAAVPRSLWARWTYVRGSSRHALPPLLRRLGGIGLFVHDSLHTERNLRFELELAWEALEPGGIAIADDIEGNQAFDHLVQATGAESIVARHEKKRGLFGMTRKEPEGDLVPARASAADA